MQVIVRQGKIENVEVLFQPVGMARLGNGDDAALDEEAQTDLSCRLAVLLSDGLQYRIRKEVIFSGREGAPCFHLRAMLLKDGLQMLLLVKGMSFYLIDCRNDAAGLNKV